MDVEHWRKFCKAVKTHETWSEGTRFDIWKRARVFAGNVLDTMNLPHGFFKAKDCRFEEPEGDKIQFKPEQIQTALNAFTGPEERKVLLLGLNAGLTASNLLAATLTVAKGHLMDTRTKTGASGVWLLWDATKEVLDTPIAAKDIAEFNEKAKTLGLPTQKALRTTMAQRITEIQNSDVAKLFRAESGSGVHFRNYVNLGSDAMVARLDDALRQVESELF